MCRLLALALLSIGTDQLSKAIGHVRETDKKALIAIIEASQHELSPAIARSLRESSNARSPQSASAKPVSATKPRAETKASGGFGLKHVVVALTFSAIAGALLTTLIIHQYVVVWS
jgi:activator of HSP90 ATPase